MTLTETMHALESLGNEQTRKTWANHGATGAFWGVKIGDMKVLRKKIKRDQELALALYDTGNADAMYFAGLICDPKLMTKEQLQHWAESASWYMLSEYTVAWAASESPFGHELAMQWISSGTERLMIAGWSTYACLLALVPDEALDKKEIGSLMTTIAETIQAQPDRLRYVMNGFLIAVGSYVPELTDTAKMMAARIGKVKVNMGNTACKVPDALAYIEKVAGMGRVGQKRKTVFC